MPSNLAKDTAGPLAVECYRRVAKLQTIYGSLCADEGVALREEQEVLLGQVVLLVMDGLMAELADLLTCDSDLRTNRRVLGWQPDVRAYDAEAGR